ncbi:MAG: methyltransferase domain-containing protein, partial [Gallionella sp.]
ILDIGAADRWIEPHLPEGVDYFALDYPSTGRDLYGARPHAFADAAHLPFADAHFDGAICLEVLEHVPDPAIVIGEIARVIKSGGRAWISMPFLYPLHDAPFDFQRYTEFGLRRDVERAGLQVVTLRKSGHAVRAAGLLMCLAIAGGAHAQRRPVALLLLPLVLIAVLAINITAWLSSLVWPDWRHMAMGYELEARKP